MSVLKPLQLVGLCYQQLIYSITVDKMLSQIKKMLNIKLYLLIVDAKNLNYFQYRPLVIISLVLIIFIL